MPAPGPSRLLAQAQGRWMTDVQLWRAVDTPDGQGGTTRSWGHLAFATVQVALGLPSSSEREVAAQQGIQLTHSGKAPAGTDIRRGDRLVTPTGQVIEIVDVRYSPVTAVLELGGREEPWDEPIGGP